MEILLAGVSAAVGVAAAILAYYSHMHKQVVEIRSSFDQKGIGTRMEVATAFLKKDGLAKLLKNASHQRFVEDLLADLNQLAMISSSLHVWERAVNNVRLHEIAAVFGSSFDFISLIRTTRIDVRPCWNGDRTRAFWALEELAKRIDGEFWRPASSH